MSSCIQTLAPSISFEYSIVGAEIKMVEIRWEEEQRRVVAYMVLPGLVVVIRIQFISCIFFPPSATSNSIFF